MNKKIKTASILMLMSLVCVPGLWSASVITGIQISGIKRSEESFIREVIAVQPGDFWYEGVEEEIRQKLIDEDLFIEPSIRIDSILQEEGYELRIGLREKISLLPIPLAMVADDSYMLGFMLLDSNFRGRGEILSAGLFYMGDMITGMVSYSQDLFMFGGSYFTGEKVEVSLQDDREQEVRLYDLNRLILSFQPKKDFGPFSLALPLSYLHSSVSDPEGEYGLADPESVDYFSTGLSLSYSKVSRKKYYREGIDISTGGDYLFFDSYKFDLEGNFSFASHKNLYSLDFSGKWGELAETEFFSIGNKTGSRTLPGGISTDAYINTTAAYERIFATSRYTNLSATLFYETGVYSDLLDDSFFYHGPGLGLSVYLNRVVFPALQLTGGWNIPLGEFYASMSMGLMF